MAFMTGTTAVVRCQVYNAELKTGHTAAPHSVPAGDTQHRLFTARKENNSVVNERVA